MEIIVGKRAGFCGGVVNSVTKTQKLLDKEGKMYCLGEIVHNKQVVNSLKDKGLTVISSLDEVSDGSKVIIRAHGVAKSIYEEAASRNIELFDLTCPNVLKIHEKIESYVDNGYYVILVGNKNHPEVIGSLGFCNSDSLVIEDVDDTVAVINYIKLKEFKKVALFCQTTYSLEKFNKIEAILKEKLNDIDLKIMNTICNATELRQKETLELAKKVDAMIIIGGSNSSNTLKLFEIASKVCKSFLIETVDDIDFELNKDWKVGVMAGASTPKESIEDVIEYLNDNY